MHRSSPGTRGPGSSGPAKGPGPGEGVWPDKRSATQRLAQADIWLRRRWTRPRRAGHCSIESTRIYLHLANEWLVEEYRRAALAIDSDLAALIDETEGR